MRTHFNPKNNPRVIIIQKLYGNFFNEDNNLEFPKHRFKKFIKDIVLGTIERNDLILTELDDKLGDKFDLKKFHSLVLNQGIVPLFILEDLIDEWIKAEVGD